MQQNWDQQHIQTVLDFILVLSDTMSRKKQLFEDETACSPEETNVIRILSHNGPLMVKEIAQALPGMNFSKLTRILGSLEKQDYVIRTLNQKDRRSFLITPTEKSTQLNSKFMGEVGQVAEHMLSSLTPTERLMVDQLLGKMQIRLRDITTL
ncbi:hypothetical protein PMSD_13900 [Paenibacillus macquariensis subsp. defensor]|nr:hypothetical protein PMSD_13900 [Paenibacillus macquariensis subsp. defensor]